MNGWFASCVCAEPEKGTQLVTLDHFQRLLSFFLAHGNSMNPWSEGDHLGAAQEAGWVVAVCQHATGSPWKTPSHEAHDLLSPQSEKSGLDYSTRWLQKEVIQE